MPFLFMVKCTNLTASLIIILLSFSCRISVFSSLVVFFVVFGWCISLLILCSFHQYGTGKRHFFGFNDLFFYFLLRIWMMNGVKAARRTNKKCICQKRKRKRINGRHIRVKVFHIKAKDRRYKKNNAFSFWSMLLQPSTLCFILLNH